MKFVLDASVALSWLLNDVTSENEDYVLGVLRHLRTKDCTAIVPVTWYLEIVNVIAKVEARGQHPGLRSDPFLNFLTRAPIAVDPLTAMHAPLGTLSLARQHGLSAYDASYLELALRINAPIATLDKELRTKALKAGATVLTTHSD